MQFISKKTVLKTRPFKVEELTIERAAATHIYHRLDCPDWTNILPITPDGKAVLIRQQRVGCLKEVLELPGGMMDPGERDATLAAARELEEETGYTSQRFLSLGSINPNPAIQNNQIHMFLALGATLNASRQNFPDADEEIFVELVDAKDLDYLVRTGQLGHALAALTVMLAGKYLDIGASPRTTANAPKT